MIRPFFALSLMCLAVSGSAFAMPAVGDSAQFDLEYIMASGGQRLVGTLEVSLTEFNASLQQYKQKQAIAISDGQAQAKESWVAAGDLITEALVNATLGDCASNGGTLQEITVPAGNFFVCAMPFDNVDAKGTIWIGMAPFGVIKQDSVSKHDDNRILLSLKAYHNG